MSKGKEPEEYVRKIQEDTRRYVESLLQETEKLRVLVKTLEEDKEQLHREVDELRGRLHRQQESQTRLEQELTEVQELSNRHAQDFALVEQQNADLATLYVAGYRLHGTLRYGEVLDTIKEIITNLVGSEEIAVFQTTNESDGFELVAINGLEREYVAPLGDRGATIHRLAREEQLYLEGKDGRVDNDAAAVNLSACIPMRVDERLVGVIAVFRLFEQKSGWAEVDQQLFELLGTQAAVALFTTKLIAQSQ